MRIIQSRLALIPGTRLGVYEVTATIGEGGMGQVFRARDTKLNRDVALKVLPDSFLTDPERLARFTREAQTLASLNHPNIAHLHGLEESGGVRALVMELVDGDDLSTRIACGAIPIDEAIPIAVQIAMALEAAHEQGIIHRDLKPANLKVRPDGTVKVLDFGLAKAMDQGSGIRDQGSGDLANSPTITSPAMTMRGVILGTAAYMSPEQAKGRVVDKRTDIWAFGCVLYEMLTRRKAFDGSDVTETIAFVLTKEPDWQALPPNVPEGIRKLLRRCLEKDSRERLRDIGDARLSLREASEPAITDRLAGPPPRRLGAGAMSAAALLLVAGVIGGVLTGRALMRPAEAPGLVSRFDITPPIDSAVTLTGNSRDLAISRDGRRIAYVGGNGGSLFVRDVDRSQPVRLVNMGFPSYPFFSSDGNTVGFTDGAEALRRVPASGGAVELITRITGPGVKASAGPDGTVAYAIAGTIWRVPLTGGQPTLVAKPDLQKGEGPFSNPEFLPTGRSVLVSMSASGPTALTGKEVVIDLATGERKVVADDAINGQYVSSGHLVYRSGRTIRAIAFDLDRLEASGAPVQLPEPILIGTFGNTAQFDVAANGTLVYVPADAPVAARRMVWVSRDGREQPSDLPVRSYTYVAIAPNGSAAALDIRDQENDIWIWDFTKGTLKRLTFGPQFEQSPRWAADSQQLFFALGRSILKQRADGTGKPEAVTTTSLTQAMLNSSPSPDGTQVLVRVGSLDTSHDISVASLTDGSLKPLLQSPAGELNAELSPDGRWMSYESNESGAYEIYVRPFPDVNAGRWQISSGGGRKATWNRNGRELYFVSATGAMMAVPIEKGAAFSAGAPVQLFRGDYYFGSASSIGRTYDVSADGQKFLMIKEDRTRPTSLSVVLNWTETLKRLVPTGKQPLPK